MRPDNLLLLTITLFLFFVLVYCSHYSIPRSAILIKTTVPTPSWPENCKVPPSLQPSPYPKNEVVYYVVYLRSLPAL